MIVSIFLLLALGLCANWCCERLRLPGLLGMIGVGVLLGPYSLDLLDPVLLQNAGDLRTLALVIILLRAGLGLEKSLLRSVGVIAFKMSAFPALCEGLVVMGVAHGLLGLPLVEAGMLGFILAAVTPAVIVPAMLDLKERGLGMQHGVPVIVLAGASIDDVFAITLFSVFVGLATQAGQPLLGQLLRIPVQIVGGAAIGGLIGWGLAVLLRRAALTRLEALGLVMAGSLGALLVGETLNVAGLLGVMTVGFVLLERVEQQAVVMEQALGRIWFFAQIFLFVLIGAEVDVAVAWQAGLLGVAIIGIGLLGRTLGVLLALHGSELTFKERLFAAIAYLPKATVQAAVGGIPLTLGMASGDIILAIAVLSVVITAPLGAVAIRATAPQLLAPANPPEERRVKPEVSGGS